MTVFAKGGVPEMRTGRAEKPISSASDPSTRSGRLWTGGRSHQATETTPRSSRRGKAPAVKAATY